MLEVWCREMCGEGQPKPFLRQRVESCSVKDGEYALGAGDSSGRKVLSMQAWGLEFKSQDSYKKLGLGCL